MPLADQGVPVRPADVERWLDELGLTAEARTDREGVTSWDLRLDGRRRFDVPVTLFLDPHVALIVWVHFAPPIADAYRKSYRKLLRWNDELPFAKFSLAADERPVLTIEIAPGAADRDVLGVAVARSLAIADQLLEESASWLWIGGRVPETSGRESRGAHLIDRYRAELGELAGEPRPDPIESPGSVDPAAAPTGDLEIPASTTTPTTPAATAADR
jgi:Putative bacterial sensory transduction regulator